MARNKDKSIHIGDVVYIEAKEVEGVVVYSDALSRQVRIDDADPEHGTANTQTNTMFYSWDECEVVKGAAKEPEAQRGRRTPAAGSDDAKPAGKGAAKVGGK